LEYSNYVPDNKWCKAYTRN